MSTLENIHPQLRALALPIGDLNEDPDNANEHNDFSRATLIADFTEFGQRKPIVVRREGMIVEAGNGTLAALREAGWSHIACVVCDDDETKARAFALADNQTARLSAWNFDKLRENAEHLLAADYDVLSLGWTGDGLADILSGKAGELAAQLSNDPTEPEPPTPENNPPPEPPIPEPPVDPITKPGDIWIMGDHRLICGSCRDPETVARLLDGEKINVAFTSPPYASQRKYDEASGFKPIKPDDYVEWFEAVQANVREHLAEDGSWFVNIKPASEGLDTQLYVMDLVIHHSREWSWHYAGEFCWERIGLPGLPRRRFKNQYEPVFQFSRGDWKFRPKDVRHKSANVPVYDGDNPSSRSLNTWAGDGQSFDTEEGLAYPGNRLPPYGQGNETKHSASFPIGLPTFFIKAYSDEGDIIFDPFDGSGTTIIAAEREKRRGRGCEISPKYCDVTVARWEAETGLKAVLAC